MSLTTIAARFTDQPVKLDGAQDRRVLTTLKMIYEGGSLDGKTANFPTRDLSCVVVGRVSTDRDLLPYQYITKAK